jgi:hypothetical protein
MLFSFAAVLHGNSDATTELDMYLIVTSREIVSQLTFPGILKLFKQYNMPLSSSAPIEQLFSLGGQNLVLRNQMTDVHFEHQLFLRANKLFVRSCH